MSCGTASYAEGGHFVARIPVTTRSSATVLPLVGMNGPCRPSLRDKVYKSRSDRLPRREPVRQDNASFVIILPRIGIRIPRPLLRLNRCFSIRRTRLDSFDRIFRQLPLT
jgi:hypothetical protein